MINFRFHLVSLVAVFLALALGVVMGSTVIDRAIVDGLKSRIDRVERNADERRAENLELKRRVDSLEAYAEEAAPLMLGGRLKGVALTLVAVRGVDDGAVRSTTETLREGGAAVPGVVWIEPSFTLAEEADRTKLGEAVGDPFHQGEALRQAVVEAL
ncbi:MAG TPA: copper transporter, partial [Acidimicrobiia bacterium]|nr:copper transporter [Acidimicrobiia bacterium]